jgi:beta-lactamase regulating signal transducer with metallopeptidase domain
MANELSNLIPGSFAPASFAPASFAPGTLTLATTYLLHSTLLLGGAWLAVRMGRIRSEALKERLWKLSAVLALVTVPLQLGLGFSPPTLDLAFGGSSIPGKLSEPVAALAASPNKPAPTAPSLLNETPRADVGVPIVETPPELDRSPAASEFVADRLPGEGEPVLTVTSDFVAPLAPEGPRAPLALTWVAGMLFGLVCAGIVRLVWQTLLFSLRLRDCRVIREPSVCRQLERIARRGGVRRKFRLLVSPTFRQPAAFGVFRWTIVLPEEVLHTFDASEVYALLAHEAAHLVRGDAIWLWWGRILCSCFAFQPLNFLARREWRRSAEILCDEWAVTRSANGLALARCLTQIAALNSPTAPRLQALWALGAVSHLGERVERLLNGTPARDAWNTRARGRLVTLVAAGIACLFVCAAPRTTVFAGAGAAVANGRGERAAFASLSPGERTVAAALGQELTQLHSEIDAVVDMAETRRPGDAPVGELARRIAAWATQLHDRYQRLTLTPVIPADHFAAGPDRADLSKGAEP